MSLSPTAALPLHSAARSTRAVGVQWGLLVAAAAAFTMTALAPIGASIATVFLFAGPHNWFEARYFLRRLPPRWHAMRGYLGLAACGVVGLTIGFALLPTAAAGGWGADGPWGEREWTTAIVGWNLSLVAWTTALACYRRRLAPARRWPWLWPIAAVTAVAAWYAPRAWDIGLVYAHPLLALAFLDRELGRTNGEARAAFRRALPLVFAFALLLIGVTADAEPLVGTDVLSLRIEQHAGSEFFTFVSNRCPVALHVYLETIHYAVWIVLLPYTVLRTKPWRLDDLPPARRSPGLRVAVGSLLVVGAVVAVVLWCGFLIDYPQTRDVYFTVAMLHVLAEIPFLLRLT